MELTQKLSKGKTDSDDGLSHDEANFSHAFSDSDNEVQVVSVSKSKKTKKSSKNDVMDDSSDDDETRAVNAAKGFIGEIPSDLDVLADQEAKHLEILIAAAKTADIATEASFITPAMNANTFQASKALLATVELSQDRLSHLGFQLKENLSTVARLEKVVNKRTAKGSFLPTYSSENVWGSLQVILDRQLKQERAIKSLEAKAINAVKQRSEVDKLLKNKNEEVEAMKLGFRQSETLLVNRILTLEKECDTLMATAEKGSGSSTSRSASDQPDFSLWQERHTIAVNRIDEFEKKINAMEWSASNTTSTSDISELYKTVDNISKEVDVIRSQLVSPSKCCFYDLVGRH